MTKCVLTMMDFVLKTMNFVLNMMHFMGKVRVVDSPDTSAVFAVPGVFPPLELAIENAEITENCP